MLRLLRRQPWTCQQCLLRRQHAQYRSFRTTRASAFQSPAANTNPSITTTENEAQKRKDDQILRQIFDSHKFWSDFSEKGASLRQKGAGLVQNQFLTRPEGFRQFAQVSLQKCQKIVAKVLAASTTEDYINIARDLDRLSDLLCRVIDLSDFIRAVHTDQAVEEAATQAYALMFEYMNVLNTTTALNDQIKRAIADPAVTAHWSEEEKVTANILMKDFAKSAIHLPPGDRQRFVDLSNDISQLGPDFVNLAEPAKPYLTFSKSHLRGLDPQLVRKLQRWPWVALPMSGEVPSIALGAVHDEATRKEIYTACRTSSNEQVDRLNELLEKRAELAKLSGYPSFAHMTLSDKMAKTPEAVSNFLTALNTSNGSGVHGELSKLLSLKRMDQPSARRLYPWDHMYYVNRYANEHSVSRKSRDLSLVSSYFSLGTVMQGLSRLFSRLYGVRLVPREPSPGETWNSDVRRLDVIDETDGHIAVIYCDLFARPGKSPNPAHFTLRCSREISQEEIAESATSPYSSHPNDGMPTGIKRGTNSLYQLPVIALICDFTPSQSSNWPPTLLSQYSVQTLFHEMGHAIHSILGRTSLQTISGTRCATDFAELPSVLMEHFATAPEVLSLYARHWETDAPIPESVVRSMALKRYEQDSTHGSLDNETQILMALLDQACHTSKASSSEINSTEIYHRVFSENGSLFDLPQNGGAPTSWQGFFGHLYGYGATYYSYLFDRAIASKIWGDVFQKGEASVDRKAGERFRNEVLQFGGGRDGWKCVAGVLGESSAANKDGRLAEGGEEAMREVGRWGLRREERPRE
ncbi:Mitochondrial intermediate peptidase [Arachnomyces sp. PD_36]|nr:Mitochondrial intermediate peptidase [Arachnomyces sp. PD_36]